MTENNFLQSQNIINNNSKGSISVKISMFQGITDSNTIEEPINENVNNCEPGILWFYCQDNTQYLFLI